MNCKNDVAPESWIGGPLAVVETGDIVELDVPERKLNLKVSDKQLEQRRAAWKPKSRKFEHGYGKLFSEHIRQANEGRDFDFLERTAATPEPEIH